MAADDAKLKFLPRHLQRSQPAGAPKSKRRVTVEDENAGDEESDRRSVFERLGPGSSQRNEVDKMKPCYEFQERGECSYGKSCIYNHVVKERKRDDDKSPDSLRLKFKGGKDRENKVRSQVVVRKAGGGSEDDSGEDSDSWSIDKLADKKELELEQKRQEIQRALIALEEGEEVPAEPKKTDSSGSESSPERPQRKKKDKARKKEKKKHKKAALEKEQSVEKSKDSKRKHESDGDDMIPHKKRKKKNKDRKHTEETLPSVVSESVGKQKKGSQIQTLKTDLYKPDSPTSIVHGDSGDEKHSSSFSPKVKGKWKRKKKKHLKNQGGAVGKSKKLLSPLKKVLKQRKGPSSVASSKRSRSSSRDTPPRKHRRSRSSSSSSSSSSSEDTSSVTLRKYKSVPDISHDRGRKKSKSLEKKRRIREPQRSFSSSSSASSSSSSSSTTDRGRRRVKKISQSRDRTTSRGQKTRSPLASTVRKDMRGDKKKSDTSAESWVRSKGKDSESKRPVRRSLDRGRDKDRDTGRRNLSQAGRLVRDDRQDSWERRRDGRDQKDDKMEGRDAGRIGEGRRDNRERDVGKAERGMEARREENRDNREREREGGRGDHLRDSSLNKERERDRRGGSLDRDNRDREERNRRGFNAPHPHNQQVERSAGRFNQRSGMEDERDRRTFDDSGSRFPSSEGQRMGQFPGDRDRGRGGFDRGMGRGGENQTRGSRDWDERGRREGVEGFRDEWDGGRDSRGGGGFGGYRDDGGREFGTGRDDRRGTREERMLPHLGGGGDSGKGSMLGSDSRDRSQQRGTGYRDDFSGRDGGDRRDWKQREGSQESATRRASSRERDGSRGNRDTGGADGRSRSGAVRPASEISVKDKPSDKGTKNRSLDKSGSGAKQNTMMKVKSESGKEESPVARDEPSLATLFSQTEATPVKKKTTKSFGGKKSPKKTVEDTKSGDKVKPSLAGRMAGRGRRMTDRKSLTARRGDSGHEKEVEKEDGKDKGSKEESSKEKSSRSPSPKGSQKSGDSHHSQSKSSRRSSRSPDSKRPSTRSPGTKLAIDSVRSSPLKLSRSPVSCTSRDRERGKAEVSRSPAPSTGSGKDRRRRDNNRKTDEKGKTADKGKKRERSRSLSRSDSESRCSSRSGGLDAKRRRKSSDSESLPAKLDGGDIAAAMLGVGFDDGLQDVSSEWSDDDDNIGGSSRKVKPFEQNQVEDLDSQPFDFDTGPRNNRRSPAGGRYSDPRDARMDQDNMRINPELVVEKPVLEKNIPNVKIVEDIQKEKPAREKKRGNTDDEGYEEISSDENELDEEGERSTKRTIVSILDIDMASLLPAAKPKSASGPVFQRFKAASVFSEMGLSRLYAGEQLYKEVQEVCQKQLGEMVATEKIEETAQTFSVAPSDDVKEDLQGATPVETDVNESKPEPPVPSTDEGEEKPAITPRTSPLKQSLGGGTTKVIKHSVQSLSTKPVFQLYSDTSAYHKLYKAKAQERAGLLGHFGMFRRALTARKDLDIRRQLCGIDPKYDQSAAYPSGVVDQETFPQCLLLFKQKRPALLAAQPAPCVS